MSVSEKSLRMSVSNEREKGVSQMSGFQDIVGHKQIIEHLKNAPRMDISEISAAVKGVSEYKVDIQDYLDIFAVWYRDVLYFKATRDADGIIFRDQLASIQEQTNNCSYEGVEDILEALRKAKERLNANVNFDLTMELLFLTIKENITE